MARRKVRQSARKKPVQSRSRVTVELILDAAIRVLDREGNDAFTTSRVAEAAGVSVGSLYQYFANRDALVNALQDREFERATQMLTDVLSTPNGLSTAEVARATVDGLLKLYRAAPALHRLLAIDGLHVAPTERVQAFDLRSVAAIKAFLLLAGPRIRRRNLDAAAFVVYQSVRATMLAYLLESPAGIDDATLSEELSDFVLRYLALESPTLLLPPTSRPWSRP